MIPMKVFSFGPPANKIATEKGWHPGARYFETRHVRDYQRVTFIDIDWRNYDFSKHLEAVERFRPFLTVVKDLENTQDFEETSEQASILLNYARYVIIVPKTPEAFSQFNSPDPLRTIHGFSVPTRYGATSLSPDHFGDLPVHLLGGRPDTQRELAEHLNVVSLDCNRLTLDARFGDYFDGEIFRPHPAGGYAQCIADSLDNISALWADYSLTVGCDWFYRDFDHWSLEKRTGDAPNV